jgi:5-methylcytosine-specific restriction endonuclease McrA
MGYMGAKYYREYQRNRQANDPEYREKRKVYRRKYWEQHRQKMASDPEYARQFRDKRNARQRVYKRKRYEDPEFREKVREYKKRYAPKRRIQQRERRKTDRAFALNRDLQKDFRRRASGTHTVEEWMDLLELYENRCLCCGEPGTPEKPITRDHVIPVALGGTHDIENIQPLCMPCNLVKGATEKDYRPGAA